MDATRILVLTLMMITISMILTNQSVFLSQMNKVSEAIFGQPLCSTQPVISLTVLHTRQVDLLILSNSIQNVLNVSLMTHLF